MRPFANWLAVVGAAVSLMGSAGFVAAAEPAQALYRKTLETYPAPALASVGAREYKFLVNPDPRTPGIEESFRDVWAQVRASASRHGYTVTEKKNPLKIVMSTKAYFDTPDQALWRKGYVIRITGRNKGGKPGSTVNVTVKAIHEDAVRTLATPLTVVGVEDVKLEAEENIGFVPGGQLAGYIEKGASFSVPVQSLGTFTLGDFGKYMPELLRLGLPPETVLRGARVLSATVKPGAIVLPDASSCSVSMEAWSSFRDGVPDIQDFSFACETPDFYAAVQTPAAAEQFMVKVLQAELSGLRGPDIAPWGGSKVRRLMNRPVAAR